MRCPHCGAQVLLKNVEVKFNGMYDMHLFTRFEGDSVYEVIANWKKHNASPNPAIVGDRKVDDLGKASLCPARIVAKNPMNGKSVERSIGKMVMPESSYRTTEKVEEDLRQWLEDVSSDPDIREWFSSKLKRSKMLD